MTGAAGSHVSGVAVSQVSGGSGATESLVIGFALRYAAPLLIAIGYCVVADRRGCRMLWPLAACSILGLYVGGLALRLQTPLWRIGDAQLGFGRHDFVLSPAILIPPAAFVVYWMIRPWLSRPALNHRTC